MDRFDIFGIPPRIIAGDFAGWLREAMAARRVSARMVGMRTGINHSTITRVLQGDRDPTLSTVVALLRFFGGEPLDRPAAGGSRHRLDGRSIDRSSDVRS